MAAPSLVDEEEAARIAAELTAKYGADATDFVRARAERAAAVGDELAEAAWYTIFTALLSAVPAHDPALALAASSPLASSR
jgi:hypothetical protein